jgi:hypothetical protein
MIYGCQNGYFFVKAAPVLPFRIFLYYAQPLNRHIISINKVSGKI